MSTNAAETLAAAETELAAALENRAYAKENGLPHFGAELADARDRLADAKRASFEAIARETLGIETLRTRRSDRLDFHDVSVWGVLEALTRAYELGRQQR